MFMGWFSKDDREQVKKLQKELDDANKVMHAILARLMSLERYLNVQYQGPILTPGSHVKQHIRTKKTDGCH